MKNAADISATAELQCVGQRTPIIRVENVNKVFGGRQTVIALDDITLEIERGELVVIVGPSGSGKSTLLNLIGTLDCPTRGTIQIDSCDIASLGDAELTRLRRDKIGFIFQFFNLLPSLTTLQNVGLPLHLSGWPRAKLRERARELLHLVGLGNRLNQLPEELSGGERQRVAMARALASEPPILLADEPTGNLDSHTGAEILALIYELHETLRSTVVVVTHDDSIARFAPRRITLRDAHVVEDWRR